MIRWPPNDPALRQHRLLDEIRTFTSKAKTVLVSDYRRAVKFEALVTAVC
jgi:hypothetical protein